MTALRTRHELSKYDPVPPPLPPFDIAPPFPHGRNGDSSPQASLKLETLCRSCERRGVKPGKSYRQAWKVSVSSRSVMSSPPGSCPWDSPGKNTGVGCHALLQGIFPTQGSNPGLLHHRQILYHLSHQGSPLRLLGYICWNVVKRLPLQTEIKSQDMRTNTLDSKDSLRQQPSPTIWIIIGRIKIAHALN